MKNLSIVFFITLILLLILNALIFFAWPIYSKVNSNKHFYSIEQQKILNLSNEDLVNLSSCAAAIISPSFRIHAALS